MTLPILDPKPTAKAQDWFYERIRAKKAALGEIPSAWKNPLATETAPRDQLNRGTCVGQSMAYAYDLLYMMLTGEKPTDKDKAEYSTNNVDELETVHDILYPQSSSAEGFYQKSREIGNPPYATGSEIKWAVRAWKEYGMNIETNWHTDKVGRKVWLYPRPTKDGGISKEDAAIFAAKHRSNGYAIIEDESWDNVCEVIYEKGFVLACIPVYVNYDSMLWKDGTFPDPDKGGSWNVSGYHALCVYGYDQDWLYVIHSWGSFCGRFGKFSRRYFDIAKTDWLEFWVVLDDADVRIAREYYVPMTIYSNVSGTEVFIEGIMRGYTPLTVSFVHDQNYSVTAHAAGYVDQTQTVNSDVFEVIFKLEPETKVPWYVQLLRCIGKTLGGK